MSILLAVAAGALAMTAIWLAVWRRAACDLAHEVRRPMTALLMVAEGMRGQIDESDLDALARQVERASQLLSGSDWGSKTWSRLRSHGDETSERTSELVDDIIRAWVPVARTLGRCIHLTAMPTAGEVRNAEALNQALANLLANALEHGRGDVLVSGAATAGGQLEIAVRNAASEDRVWGGDGHPRGRGRRIAQSAVRRSGGSLTRWTRQSQTAQINLPLVGGRQ